MKDYLSLGPVPIEENCVQVGTSAHDKFGSKEASVFKQQLIKEFPNGDFKAKTFYHDFGSYKEVCIYFDDENESEMDYAYMVEENLPLNWTEESKTLLGPEYFYSLNNKE